MTALKTAGCAALLVAGVVLGGWQAGWWFTTQNVNRRAHVYRQSYEAQQTLRDEITKHLGDYQDIRSQGSGSNAQALAVADIICGEAAKVTGDPLPADQAAWVAANCQYGSARR